MANTKIPSELIADSSITAAKLADGTITTADIADSNVTTAKIADSNITTAKIGDAQVTTAKIVDANVTTAKIADDAVTTAKIADNSVTSDTLASGLTLSGNTATADMEITSTNRDMLHLRRNSSNGDAGINFENTSGNLGQFYAMSNGNFYVDASADIKLDADSSNIYLTDGGTDIGLFSVNNQDLNIRNLRSDKDIYFQGNDSGTTFTALSLDMSAAGAATFNSTITLTDTLSINGATAQAFLQTSSNVFQIGTSSNDPIDFYANNTRHMSLRADGEFIVNEQGNAEGDFRVESDTNTHALFVDASENRVGIGLSNPSKLLHVNGQAQFENNIILNENTPALVIPNGDFRLFTGGSETLRVTSGRNLQFIAKTTNFESPGFTYHTNNYLYLRGGTSGLILSDDSGINTIQIIDGSNGYINFETSDGSSKMHLASDGALTLKPNGITTGLRLQGRSSDNNFYIQFKSNDGNTTYSAIGTDSANTALFYQSNTHKFQNTASNSTYMTIDSSGQVGIGTAPSKQLHLKHSTDPTIMLTRTYSSTSGNIGALVFGNGNWDSSMASIRAIQDGTNDGGKLEFKTQADASGGEVTRFTIFKTGLSTFSGPASLVNLGGGSTGSAALYVNSTSGHTGEMLQILKNGASKFEINSLGNVGIGTASPVNNGTNSTGLTINGTGNYQNLTLQKDGATQFMMYLNGPSGVFLNQITNDPIMFYTNDSHALTIAADGEIYNDSTRAAGVTLNGFVNLGKNDDGRTDLVRIRGTSLYQQSSGNRYGNYGSLMLNSTANWTGAARRVLITNGLNSYKFGIIAGTTSATTDPTINTTATNGGSIVNGTPNFVIDLTNNRIGYNTDSPAFSHHTKGTTEGSNSSSASGQQHSAVQSTNASAGGYYEKVRYYNFSGNSDHTLVWGNTDSYFSAMVELWAGCSNGGTRNNIYVRGFWHSNHTAHLWDELDRTANVANGDTFTFTAGEYSSGSTASKLTLFHDYGSASFYYGKVKITVIAGDYSYYNIS